MKALYTIVGIGHRGAFPIMRTVKDGAPVLLEREPDNRYDSGAIKVHVRYEDRWAHIGYIKGTENKTLSALMDRAAEPGTAGTRAGIYRSAGYHHVEVEE